jgi:hypothetical protein
MPRFEHGTPAVRDYHDITELCSRIARREADIVIDCWPPPLHETETWPINGSKWAMLLGPELTMHVNSEAQLLHCDLFLVQSDYLLESCIAMMTQDRDALRDYIRDHISAIGKHHLAWIDKHFQFQWSHSHADYFRKHAVVTGTSALDVISRINPAEVRKRWGLTPDKPVVAYFPCPFGRGPHVLWEQLFMSTSRLQRLYYIWQSQQWQQWRHIFRYVTHDDVIRAVRTFCTRNNALLVTKMRHTMPEDRLLQRCSDLVLNQDEFYPHSALELFSISKLSVGYYTSGSFEAVALGAHYLNVDIPGFPKEFYCRRRLPGYTYCDHQPGVVTAMPASDVTEKLPACQLDDFPLDPAARDRYLDLHSGPLDGRSSARILDAIEQLQEHRLQDVDHHG